MSEITGYYCGTCGQWHEGMPMDIAFNGPEPFLLETAEKDGQIIESSSEWYVVGGTGFIRAVLDIPCAMLQWIAYNASAGASG